MNSSEAIVKVKNLVVEFPGVRALDNVNFDLRSGEVHVLLGENGAGKSTLVKVLSGVNTPLEGTIYVDGKKFQNISTSEARDIGISVIYQELSLVEELSISDNLFVGEMPTKRFSFIKYIDKQLMYNETKKVLKEIGLNKDPNELIRNLSISEKQMVEIAKAIVLKAKIVIMDEPTSSLSPEEVDNLFRIIKDLKNSNVAVIYISHKLEELKKIGDRVTVLKDGKKVVTENIDNMSEDDLVNKMVGRNIETRTKRKKTQKEPILEVKNLFSQDGFIRDVSFNLNKGEILGFGGLIGAGRSELMEMIFGLRKSKSGEIYLNNELIDNKNSYHSLKNGIAFLSENRRETGFFKNFTVSEEINVVKNISRSKLYGTFGVIDKKEEKLIAEEYMDKLSIKSYGLEQMTRNLSGGNQQKVIISKWLAVNPGIFIFDEPTKGIDVGSKEEIYSIMDELTLAGKSIIVISSDLPELISLSDRVIVMNEGSIQLEIDAENITEEIIMKAATNANSKKEIEL